MNINAVFNPTRPVSLYEKEKDRRDTGFLDILAQTAKEAYTTQESAEQVTEYTASAEETAAVKAETRNEYNPDYTLTDEEAEYFREKYGEDYDEEKLKDFFFELAEKGVISADDAMSTTRMAYIRKVETIGYVPPGATYEEERKLWEQGKIQYVVGKKIWSTTRSFERDYNIFKQSYTKDVTTWEDYMQEQLDFIQYLKDSDVIHTDDGTIPNTFDWDVRQSRIEKTAEIIRQIFGQSAGGDINEY
ncbi:MAG: hypothetical protein J1F11_12935 [Oscillospiraceae bacterium]|nr:hypothetical protein [Oscillospiraceae bacterium]